MKKLWLVYMFSLLLILSGCVNNHFLVEDSIEYGPADQLRLETITNQDIITEVTDYLNGIRYKELEIDSAQMDDVDKAFYDGILVTLPNNELHFAISDSGRIFYYINSAENENIKFFYASTTDGHKQKLIDILEQEE